MFQDGYCPTNQIGLSPNIQGFFHGLNHQPVVAAIASIPKLVIAILGAFEIGKKKPDNPQQTCHVSSKLTMLNPKFIISSCYRYEWIWSMKYPLVMTNIAMENGPFIDGLPVYLLKMVIFHGCVSHKQMVSPLDLHELTMKKTMVFTLKNTSQEPSLGIHQQCLVSQRCHFNITGAPWQLWWKPISKSTEW